MNEKRLAILMLFLAAIFWSTSGVLIKLVALHPMAIAGWRSLIAGVAAVAQNRGIQLKSVRATLEGDMDLAGVLGIDADVRNGFRSIKVAFDIDADATPDEIAALVAQSQKRSAVFDIVTNPTNVHVTVD